MFKILGHLLYTHVVGSGLISSACITCWMKISVADFFNYFSHKIGFEMSCIMYCKVIFSKEDSHPILQKK